jgi:uncharacterized membrane protein YgcG
LIDPATVLLSKKDVPTAGQCRLHVLVGKQGLPKKICMVRQTGMVIDYYTPRVGLMPFSGLFTCDDEVGNKILKFLEPPRHDRFDPNRADTPEQHRILDDIKQWVRGEVVKLLPKSGSTEINETNVPRDLLDIDANEPPAHNWEPEEEDIIGVAGKITDVTQKKATVHVPVHARASTTDGPGGSGRNSGTGGTGTGPGPGAGGSHGGTGGAKPAEAKISFRFFRPSGLGEDVTAVFRTDLPFHGDIRILIIGEDGTTQPVYIDGCSDENDRKVGFSGSEITNIKILPNRPETYRVKIRGVVQGGLVAEGLLKI